MKISTKTFASTHLVTPVLIKTLIVLILLYRSHQAMSLEELLHLVAIWFQEALMFQKRNPKGGQPSVFHVSITCPQPKPVKIAMTQKRRVNKSLVALRHHWITY